MRATKAVILIGLITAAAAIIEPASAAAPVRVSVRCSFRLHDPALFYQVKGIYSGGSATCNKPLGNGHYSGTYHDMVAQISSETGRAKISFKHGTIHGTYEISGPFVTRKYNGHLLITGGTGRFKHATGTLQLRCTKDPPDGSCKASGKLAGI